MLKLKTMGFIVAMSMTVAACADSTKKTSSRRQLQSAEEQEKSSDQNKSNSGATLDCDSQWSLALRQQPVGSTFNYDSSVSLSNYSEEFVRSVRITSSTPDALSQTISIDNQFIRRILSGLSQQNITLPKSKFLQACQSQIAQPVAIGIPEGQFIVKSKSAQTLSIQGKVIPVDVIDMELKNASYGGFQVSATIKMFLSSSYPALPIKQILTIMDSPSVPLIRGATFVDTLDSPLPVSN